jgi:hypothetical protein
MRRIGVPFVSDLAATAAGLEEMSLQESNFWTKEDDSWSWGIFQ